VLRIQRRLERVSYPRLQMTLIVALTAGSGLLASFLLLDAGVDAMALRYPLAVAIAYAAFLLLLWAWLRQQSIDANVPDFGWQPGRAEPGSGGSPVRSPETSPSANDASVAVRPGRRGRAARGARGRRDVGLRAGRALGGRSHSAGSLIPDACRFRRPVAPWALPTERVSPKIAVPDWPQCLRLNPPSPIAR